MYVKTTTRKVKGGEVRYLHLAHNEWDAAGRRSGPKLLYSFGREDPLGKDPARAPSSKLAAAEWMSRDVRIDGVADVSDDACYRAMDWLHAVRAELEKQVYVQVADLLDLEVDLLFFDTTSTYFELEDADEEAARNWRGERASGGDADPGKTAGFRTHGKSKDSRDDLPQIVIGMPGTRQAIPVRARCRPGNTADSALIRQVRDDM